MRWTRHVADMGEMRNAYKIFVRNLKGKDHVEDLCVNWRIILEGFLWKQGVKLWTWLRIGISGWSFRTRK
jgi:hypothetical protein